MPFTPQEISDKEFVVAMRGYERAEVQAFLRAVAADIAQLRAEADAARARADAATKETSGDDAFGRLGESIAMMLRQAKETTTASLEAAESEAEQVKGEARERAEEWLRLARERADLIISTAQADADRRTDQAAERSETMLEEARARAEALVANAEARSDQMLTTTRTEAIRLEAACEDLRQRLTLSHSILGDLLSHMPETSVLGAAGSDLEAESFSPDPAAPEGDTTDSQAHGAQAHDETVVEAAELATEPFTLESGETLHGEAVHSEAVDTVDLTDDAESGHTAEPLHAYEG